ncbi:MAG: hypothetical protein HY282_03760 [Nitrospirae bacterium]|nr:hypothetical protein [Candidatus Manganitrophaceae bacterium]
MRRQAALAILLYGVLFFSGCGDTPRAPFDATVTGPDDADFKVNPPGGGTQIVQALDFQVHDKDATMALPGVEVEMFAGGGGILTDLDGNPLDANTPSYFKTKTDARGLARASFLIALPACSATEDLVITGTVSASAGGGSKLWTGTFTVTKCS